MSSRPAPVRSAAVGAVVAVLAALLPAGSSPAAASEPVRLLADTFDRTVVDGLGATSPGGSYRTADPRSDFDVRGNHATVHVPQPRWSRSARATSVVASDTRLQVRVNVDSWPQGYGQLSAAVLRSSGSGEYRVRLRGVPDGTVRLSVVRFAGGAESFVGGEVTVPGLRPDPGSPLWLAAEVVGTGSASLRAKAWKHGSPEPDWQLRTTDGSALPPGSPGLWFYADADADGVWFSVDDLLVTGTPAGGTAPAPAPTSAGTSDDGAVTRSGGTPAADAGASVGAGPVGSAQHAVPSGAVVVAPWGNDGASGTSSSPLRTISRAVEVAPHGGSVVVRGGRYHEEVRVAGGKRLTLQSWPGEAVWLDGARAVDGWQWDGGFWAPWQVWHDRRAVHSEVSSSRPYAAFPDMVWLDGRELREVGSRGELRSGTFFVDQTASRLWLGDDPRDRRVRASDLTLALRLDGDGSAVRGIGVTSYATPDSSPGTVQITGDRTVLEDVTLTGSATTALHLRGYGQVLRRTTVTGAGKLGVNAYQADGLVVERSRFDGNNDEGFRTEPVSGGLKAVASRGVRVRDSQASDNTGRGLWFDESSFNVDVTGNRLQRNTVNGVEIELTALATVANNLVTGSGQAAIWVLDSSEVQVWNNTLADNFRGVQVMDGPREWAKRNAPGVDWRHPDDPRMTWIVDDVLVRNNLVQGARPHSVSLVEAEDVSRRRTGNQMGISTDRNAYWRSSSSSPRWFAVWADYPRSPMTPGSLAELRDRTGQERTGFERVGGTPYLVDAAGGDFRVRSDSPTRGRGQPLPADVAGKVGVAAGSTVNLGVLR